VMTNHRKEERTVRTRRTFSSVSLPAHT
jgi:hypothetical protein